MDFTQLPQGMDFFKQFLAQNPAFNTVVNPNASLNPNSKEAEAIFTMPSMNSALSQAMAQYMMPTIDLVELDKRLNDLRIVLQFMEMNTTVLRQSLQTLELQRNAVVNFQAMMQAKTTPTA